MKASILRRPPLPWRTISPYPHSKTPSLIFLRLLTAAPPPGLRHLHTSRPRHSQQQPYTAVVAGSGPAGLAVVGNLLEHPAARNGKGVLWADPAWQAGDIGGSWREVPSNTKANLFVKFAEATGAFRQVIDETPAPNALTTLKSLEQDKGCQISYAADMCSMLTDGVVKQSGVDQRQGTVTGADWDDSTSAWTVQIENSASPTPTISTISTSRLILCVGATPTSIPLSVPDLQITQIPLGTMFQPSALVKLLSPSTPTTVAVIGASHSAILVLLNLVQLAQRSHPLLRVRWFTRHTKLKYAIYEDGKIYYDNTGLKGLAADFAREQLEGDQLATSDAGKVIERVDCSEGKEQEAYRMHLPECTHVVHAVGFTTNKSPTLTRNGRPFGAGVRYDHVNGGFMEEEGRGKSVPGLFGAGIAFPEMVTDPAGHRELSVGLWKFMTYLKRVVPAWLGEGGREVVR